MIGHITTGSSARGIFNYLLNPTKDPKIIGGNASSEDIDSLSLEFRRDAQKNPRVKQTIHHFSIAFAPEDGVVPLALQAQIFQEVAVGMGYVLPDGERPSLREKKASALYLAVAHGRYDPDHDRLHQHDHCHGAFSAVNAAGGWVSNSHNYLNLQPILREQERKHGLRPVSSSCERNRRAPSHGQWQRWAREMAEDRVIEPPVVSQLQDILATASADRPSLITFLDRLQAQEVSVRTVPLESPYSFGISYALHDVSFPGHKLHASLRQLVQQDRITFDPAIDLQVLEALSSQLARPEIALSFDVSTLSPDSRSPDRGFSR